MTRRTRTLAASAALLLSLCAPGSSPGQEEPSRAPGFVQREEVTLILLDVEAVDENGRPLRGLTKKDFKLYSGSSEWEIYSVDDLCSCAAAERSPAAVPSGEQAPSAASAPHRDAAVQRSPASADPEEITRYVLYFDFSQLQMDGRLHAFDEARRWVRDSMPSEAETMAAGYSPASGLTEIRGFTRSKIELLGALDAAERNSALIDTFPMGIAERVERCNENPELCGAFASEELFHGRRSLRVLKTFLAGLEESPGRKAIFFFNQNGMMFPGRPYHQIDGMTQLTLAEEVGAAANQARATLYSLNTGSMPAADDPWNEAIQDEAITLGLNFSDFTGGRQNHYAVDMSALTDRVTSTCRCIYRLGLVPSGHAPRRTHGLRVHAAGIPQDYRYRVRVLTEADRWLKKAQLVLANPSRSTAVSIAAAMVPLEARGRRWSVAVQVYLDTDRLVRLPGASGSTGEWEVGGLLHREDGALIQEMLGIYRLHESGEKRPAAGVVHERTYHEMPAGPYRLASFARDRSADLFGGTETWLELPDPRAGGVAGPQIMAGTRTHGLVPLSDFKSARSARPRGAAVRKGPVPIDPERIHCGDSLEIVTWICPGKREGKPSEFAALLLKEGVPAHRVAPGGSEGVGDCVRISDGIDTSTLAPGEYAYKLRWKKAGGGTADAMIEFQLLPPDRTP